MNNTICIYSEKNTSRLDYVLHFIFGEVLGLNYSVTNDVNTYQDFKGAKINYSVKTLDGVHITPHSLLFETHISPFSFKELFKDNFAFTFFNLSRYEEYLPFIHDTHHRFPAKESFLYKEGLLEKPIVDIQIEKLRDTLKTTFPFLIFKQNSFKTQHTVDVDQAFLYNHKGIKRWIGSQFRDFFSGNWSGATHRKLVLFGLKRDPWNCIPYIKARFKHDKQKPIFFYLMGDYDDFDKNLHWKNDAFQNQIREVSHWAEIGMHPSYSSNHTPAKLKIEKQRLETIVGQPIKKSRQHYIKLHLPATYHNLLNIGITDDYTMGYPDYIGFRAGTSHSFLWYDLSQETQTGLRIHPFCAMDVTLKNYMQLTPDQAQIKLNELKNEVSKVNGTFITIFHNESLSGYGQWKGWNDLDI